MKLSKWFIFLVIGLAVTFVGIMFLPDKPSPTGNVIAGGITIAGIMSVLFAGATITHNFSQYSDEDDEIEIFSIPTYRRKVIYGDRIEIQYKEGWFGRWELEIRFDNDENGYIECQKYLDKDIIISKEKIK